ncbi:MAG: YfhO family protein [Candidatus Levybacteria bacterium]|nr:YfhO family protein [Candidatus Levybacteria bacterium]
MKIKNIFLAILLFSVIIFGFFYKTAFNKYVPFPGDLLVSEYNPWKAYSFLGYNPGSYPNKAQYFDVLRQIYPWKTFSIDSLKNGVLPLWNPYNFSGSPLLANFQSSVFYPFNFLYFLLPQIWAWSTIVILQPFLALVFTFLYTRKIGISRAGSILASTSFAFSSFMTVWLEYNTIGHVILWLPLILLSLEKLFEKRSAIWSLILVLSLASSLFAGHIQIFVYLFFFTFLYSFARKKISLFLIFLFILSLGIGAVQLIPGIELILQSARSAHSYDLIVNKILIQPWQLAMLFVPDLFGNPATRNYFIQDTYVGDVIYVGLIPLLFSIFAIFNVRNSFVKLFSAAAFILFILITLNPLTQLIYKINIPFISSSASNLLVFLICFSLSVLCGFGVDQFIKNRYPLKSSLKFLGSFVLIFSILWLTVLVFSNLPLSSRNLIYSTILFIVALVLFLAAVVNNRIKYLVVILLILISIFDLWRFFQKFNPFSPIEFTMPTTPILDFIKKNNGINRFWGYGSGTIEANFATQYSIFSTDGYDPLYPKRYGEFIQSSKDGKIQTQFTAQTRSDAFVVPGFGETDLIANESRLKVLDLLGAKYILDKKENASTQKTFPLDRFSLVYEQDGWKIFENKKALPRAFLVSDYKVAKNSSEFEKIFFAKDFDSSKTIILEEDLKDQYFDNSNHLSDVQTIFYGPNEIQFKTNTDGKHLLFLSDTYYPGWEAYVDSNDAKIYRADYAFRAVIIPSGSHSVKFVYNPISFKIGYIISLISLALLGITLLTVKKKL